jgi:hypothetical protein
VKLCDFRASALKKGVYIKFVENCKLIIDYKLSRRDSFGINCKLNNFILAVIETVFLTY